MENPVANTINPTYVPQMPFNQVSETCQGVRLILVFVCLSNLTLMLMLLLVQLLWVFWEFDALKDISLSKTWKIPFLGCYSNQNKFQTAGGPIYGRYPLIRVAP